MAKAAKIPKTRYPRRLEDWYAIRIRKFVNEWRHQVDTYFNMYLRQYVKGGNVLLNDAKKAQQQNFQQILTEISLMGLTLRRINSNTRFQNLAARFVRSLNAFSYENVKMQAAIVGIDPISDNPIIRDYVQGKIAENVSLITSLHTNYFDSLQKDIYRSITSGGGIQDITNDIIKRTGMAQRHANLIANDQTGSIIGQLDAYRAKHAGARKYVWRSMEDQRVRPRHRELDGTTQIYDDPSGGDDGQMPGEPIMCRCVAEPVFEND